MRAGRRSGVAIAAVLAVVTACAAQEGAESNRSRADVGTLDGMELELRDEQGTCCLVYESGGQRFSEALGIPWPCRLHRADNGRLRTVMLPQGPVALVESSQPHPNLPGDCLTQVRAIMLAADRIIVSPYKDQVAACSPFFWDEKVFIGLFGR